LDSIQKKPAFQELAFKLEDQWELHFKPVEGEEFRLKLDELVDVSQIPECRDFSGSIIYKAMFSSSEDVKAIDLGVVREIASVKINGQEAGIRWYGREPLDVSGLVKTGINEIEIEVTTLMFNYMLGKKDDPVAQFWMSRSRQKTPVQSGLLGPVKLWI
jgi:hypothetical protein